VDVVLDWIGALHVAWAAIIRIVTKTALSARTVVDRMPLETHQPHWPVVVMHAFPL